MVSGKEAEVKLIHIINHHTPLLHAWTVTRPFQLQTLYYSASTPIEWQTNFHVTNVRNHSPSKVIWKNIKLLIGVRTTKPLFVITKDAHMST